MDWEFHKLILKPPQENNPPVEAFFIQNNKSRKLGEITVRLNINPFGSAMLWISFFFFSILLAFAYPSSTAYAQTQNIFLPFIASSKPTDITLAWDFNSEPDVAGYKLYLGNSSHNYTLVVDLGMTDQYTIRDLIEGTVYFFALTAYNQNGLESGFSNEVQYP